MADRAEPQQQAMHRRPRRQSEAYPAVRQFLDEFGEALTAGDAKAVASLWDTPAFVLGDEMVRVVNTSTEVEQFFAGAKEQYAAMGISEARAEILELDWLTDRIVQVEVRWPYLDTYGKELGYETSTYTLLRGEDEQLHLRIAVMHGAVMAQAH
jgi:hypothetical protein